MNKSIYYKSFVYAQFNCQTIQFVDKSLSRATITTQSEPTSDGNERIFRIPQNSKTEASPDESLVPYPEHSLEESFCPLEMQSVYSTVPADLAHKLICNKRYTLYFLVLMFNGMWLFNTNDILLEEQQLYYWTSWWDDKWGSYLSQGYLF